MSFSSRITSSALSLMAMGWFAISSHAASPSLYLNYSETPSLADITKADVCILDPDLKIDFASVRKPTHTFLAYVSTVEARAGSILEKTANALGVPVITKNEAWGSSVLDVTSDAWEKAVLQTAEIAASKGFDGLFLDTIDSIHLIAKADPSKAEKAKAAMVHLIVALRDKFPAAKVVMNRGFELLPLVHAKVDGVLVESVYQTADANGQNFHEMSPKDIAWTEQKIREVKAMGLTVYAVDYVDPSRVDLAKATMNRLSALGCVPFVTTPALDGTLPGTPKEVARRILVLFGWDSKFADKPGTWPIDTLTSGHFQVFLEWMGYELDYLDIGKEAMPASLASKYGGVILDQTLALRPDQEEPLLNWLISLKARKVPVLFGGGIPFTTEEVKDRLCREFGCQGSLKSLSGTKDVTVDHLNAAMMNAEVQVKPHNMTFYEVSAPPDATVFLSLVGKDSLGDEVRSEPLFLAPWGGMWLEPYIAQRATQDHRLFYANPLKFLQRWLAAVPAFPVPDATTINGRRIFYSHIDGDGFSSLSHFPGHPTCAEMVRDEVLKKYALPVTVSVIEAEMRGYLKGASPKDAERLQGIARSIFALPNVQAASHTFSHPFQMDPTDPNPGHYSLAHAPFNDTVKYDTIDPVRETKGSIEFINANLLPPEKRVELLLWPGNTRPGTAALKACRDLGVENMNGGDTIISRVYPGVAGIAPRTCPWGEELQVFASNQNEFMYADGFAGPYYGGFATVIDTFEMTEKPRRMKPVNVYYHFYSSTYVTSLRALKQIFDWCESQPLQPITAKEFALLARDVRDTKITQIAPSHWMFASRGKLRTLRVDESMGMPDLAQSKGVIGWKTEQGSQFIHTDGRENVELVLVPQAAPHLRLEEASSLVQFGNLSPRSASFTTSGWGRGVKLTFAGLPANALINVTKKGKKEELHADAEGVARLTLAEQAAEPITLEVVSYVIHP